MPHRNICKGGLEGFVDAKDGVSGESGLTRGLHQSIRKVPGDVRWFSESSISKEAMHRQSLDIVRTASAKKPTIDASGGDLSSSVRNHSSDIIRLNEMNRDAPLSTQRDVESIYPKRKRKDTEEHGDETPPARKSKPVGFKHGQSSPRAKMNEDYLDRHSVSVPSKNDDNDSINNLPSTKDSTAAGVKKDDSKKVDSQRRRRSKRGAKP